MAEQTFQQLIDSMTLEVWHNMRRAVETGRWPDGRTVTAEQRELCLQAVIAWEARNVPEEQHRTGYLPQTSCGSSAGPSANPGKPVTVNPVAATRSSDKGEL